MKTLAVIGKEMGVHANTIRNWLDKAGITPAFLGNPTTNHRRGLIRVLDPEQEKQLQDWLKTRANEHQHKTANK